MEKIADLKSLIGIRRNLFLGASKTLLDLLCILIPYSNSVRVNLDTAAFILITLPRGNAG